MRQSLVKPIETRDGSLSRDTVLRNFICDPRQPEKVMKRPAMWKSNVYAPAGQGFGAFDFNDTIYVWTDAGSSSGVIDESLMYRAFVYLGGSSYSVLPDNPYEVDDVVTIDGSSYVVDSVDGDNITVSPYSLPMFVGYSNITASGSAQYACYWQGGTVTQLPSLGAGTSHRCSGVQSSGVKYGWSSTSGSTLKAVLWDASDNIVDLGAGDNSRVQGSSADGSVKTGIYRPVSTNVCCYWDGANNINAMTSPSGLPAASLNVSQNGSYLVANFTNGVTPNAYYYSSGTPVLLQRYGTGINTSVSSVNDSNIKVGSATTALVSTGVFPCYWDSAGNITMLSLVTQGVAQYISNSGYLAGYYGSAASANSYPCYWDQSYVRHDLVTLGGTYGFVTWISEDGQIKAGASQNGAGKFVACYWGPDNVPVALGQLPSGDESAAVRAL